MLRLHPLIALSVLASACTLGDIDFGDRRCPCAPGWVCDASRDVCVRVEPDAAVVDSSVETGVPSDSAPPDTAVVDTGVLLDATTDAPAADSRVADSRVADSMMMMDTATPDAGMDPTACDDTLAGAIFCDGFESGIGRWDFVTEISGSARRVASPPIYRGTGSLSAETMASSGKASTSKDFPALDTGSVVARGYFHVPSSPMIGTVSLLFVGEAVAPTAGVAVQVTSEGRTQVYNGVEDRLVSGSGPVFPRDRWVCVTLRVDIGPSGRVRASANGTTIADESGLDTRPAGGYGRLTAGIEFTNAATTRALVRADEVAVDTSFIPCD